MVYERPRLEIPRLERSGAARAETGGCGAALPSGLLAAARRRDGRIEPDRLQQRDERGLAVHLHLRAGPERLEPLAQRRLVGVLVAEVGQQQRGGAGGAAVVVLEPGGELVADRRPAAPAGQERLAVAGG